MMSEGVTGHSLGRPLRRAVAVSNCSWGRKKIPSFIRPACEMLVAEVRVLSRSGTSVGAVAVT